MAGRPKGNDLEHQTESVYRRSGRKRSNRAGTDRLCTNAATVTHASISLDSFSRKDAKKAKDAKKNQKYPLRPMPSLRALPSLRLCAKYCLLFMPLEFIRVFLNLPAQLDQTLEIEPRFRQLLRIDRIRILDNRICDKAPNLLAELYQRILHF